MLILRYLLSTLALSITTNHIHLCTSPLHPRRFTTAALFSPRLAIRAGERAGPGPKKKGPGTCIPRPLGPRTPRFSQCPGRFSGFFCPPRPRLVIRAGERAGPGREKKASRYLHSPSAGLPHAAAYPSIARRKGRALFFEEALDDQGDGAVACDVAGGAEAVHGDIERNHERLLLGIEAQN